MSGELFGVVEPHRYRPDAMAMGDCKVCGHVREDHEPPQPDLRGPATVAGQALAGVVNDLILAIEREAAAAAEGRVAVLVGTLKSAKGHLVDARSLDGDNSDIDAAERCIDRAIAALRGQR